jgi:Tfp pilus assembly protein FimV
VTAVLRAAVVPLGLAAAAAVLVWAGREPWQAVQAPGAAGPDELLALVAAGAGALLLAWWALVSAVALGCVVTGRATGAVAGWADRTSPLAVRRLVALALGATLAGATGALPATAATHTPTPPDRSAAAALDGDRPSAPPPSPTKPHPPAHVTVHPGDSLWGIAANEEQRRLGRSPQAGEVARAWPRWYVANRDVVGADPDVIRPGQRLTAPRDAEADR